jgi:sterol desaturase/sphingolipid hydroxylase (fatty acid hydroxylase superfamily)
VTVLHCPADGRLRDKIAGYSHRRHHEEPRDLRYQFIHPNIVYGGWVVDLVILAIFRNPGALTGVLVATILTLNYEWIHFLIHTDYQPKRELYRRLHRAHRLHHFRNEQYWLGVTARTGDRLLGTNPKKEDVEISPTAKTALAARS